MRVRKRSPATGAIEIRVRSLTELFDPLDPAPMARRALSGKVASYLVARAGEQAVKAPLRLLVHGSESLRAHAATLTQGIQEHFRSAHAKGEKQFARRLRTGATTLGIGLAVLGASIALRSLLGGADAGAWARGLGEGFLILGWVAMWRPVEILLFEHWASHLDHALLDRLARVEVEVLSTGNAGLRGIDFDEERISR